MANAGLNKTVIMAGVCLALTAGAGQAQQETEAAERQEAIAAVKAMGAYLRTLDGVVVSADTTRDDITESGQNVEMASHLDLKGNAKGFRLDVDSDQKQRQYFYNGETVTVFAPIVGAYAVFEGGATTRETLVIASQKYDLTLPLADLFVWGTDHDDVASVTDGFPVGNSTIGGHECAHYALRQDGADWQIWIRTGDRPLPCKLVITNTDEESRPRYEATLNWDLDATIDDSDFTFDPPEDAYEIVIAPVEDGAQ